MDTIRGHIKRIPELLAPKIDGIKTNFDEWKVPWTADKAGKIDNLDVAVSTRASENAVEETKNLVQANNDILRLYGEDDSVYGIVNWNPNPTPTAVTPPVVYNQTILEINGAGKIHYLNFKYTSQHMNIRAGFYADGVEIIDLTSHNARNIGNHYYNAWFSIENMRTTRAYEIESKNNSFVYRYANQKPFRLTVTDDIQRHYLMTTNGIYFNDNFKIVIKDGAVRSGDASAKPGTVTCEYAMNVRGT